MMGKDKAIRIFGWILLGYGILGIGGNIIVSFMLWTLPAEIIVNSLFCVAFIYGGWRWAHWKPKEVKHEH